MGTLDELLFAKNDLRLAPEATARKLREDLPAWDPDELLALPETDVVEYLVAAHSVTCPNPRAEPVPTRHRTVGFLRPTPKRREHGSGPLLPRMGRERSVSGIAT